MENYCVETGWAGDTIYTKTYNGLVLQIFKNNTRGGYHYRVLRNPWNYEYVFNKTGYTDFKTAERDGEEKIRELVRGGPNLIDQVQRASSRYYL